MGDSGRVQAGTRPWRRAHERGADRPRLGAVDLFAVVRFDESGPLIGHLTARGMPVKAFDSLPAAITALRVLRSAVLVARVPLPGEDDGQITLVIRNFETLRADHDLFHDRFAQAFSEPVDPATLCAAVMRHAAPDQATRRCPGQVA